MAKLTNVRERIEHVIALVTDDHDGMGNLPLPHDQSMIITEIIVPPIEHGEKETLEIIVGDHVVATLPLRMLTDIYRAALAGGTVVTRTPDVQEGLAYVLKRTIVAWEEVHGTERFDKAVELTKLLVATLDNHFRNVRLGLKLERTILIPPRQNIRVRTSEQSTVTVWLRGLLSKDVT